MDENAEAEPKIAKNCSRQVLSLFIYIKFQSILPGKCLLRNDHRGSRLAKYDHRHICSKKQRKNGYLQEFHEPQTHRSLKGSVGSDSL